MFEVLQDAPDPSAVRLGDADHGAGPAQVATYRRRSTGSNGPWSLGRTDGWEDTLRPASCGRGLSPPGERNRTQAVADSPW